MTKTEFLSGLREALAGLPQDEIEERIAFYNEMIADRMEDGLSEEAAIAGLDAISDIANKAVASVPITKLVKERIKPTRPEKWKTALLILGFPVWFPLIVALGVIVLSLYVVLLSLVVSLWATDLSVAAAAVGGVGVSVLYGIQGEVLPAIAMFGVAVASAGVAILFFFLCTVASKGIFRLGGKLWLAIKKLFVKKENIK